MKQCIFLFLCVSPFLVCMDESEGFPLSRRDSVITRQYAPKELKAIVWQLLRTRPYNYGEIVNALKQGANPHIRQEIFAREPESTLVYAIQHPECVEEKYNFRIANALLFYAKQNKEIFQPQGCLAAFFKPLIPLTHVRDPLFDVPLIHILHNVKKYPRMSEDEGKAVSNFIMKMVKTYGADPNMPSKSGVYPLMLVPYFADEDSQVALGTCFLSHGARVDATDLDGKSALMHTADGRLDTTRFATLLVQKGANVKRKDAYDNTVVRLVEIALDKKPKLLNYLQTVVRTGK